MTLPYGYDDVKITEKSQLGVDKINDSARKFVQNDVSMTKETLDIPGTWERRWCNSGDSSLYYSKGDAVWVNVQDIDELIWDREGDIRFYAQGNPRARVDMEKADASNDRSVLCEFYKKVVNGAYDDGNVLFYLGDLSKKVQIRISAHDGNSYPPSDENTKGEEGNLESYHWVNFFDIQDEEEIRETIMRILGETEAARLAEHLESYHLQDSDELREQILSRNLSNAEYNQKYHGHSWYESKLDEGFDSVVKYVRKEYPSGSVKWFRLWRSGYLEHGGTVFTQSAQESEDRYEDDGNCLWIGLGWHYGGSQQARTYDYTPRSVQSFYQLSPEVDVGQNANGVNVKFDFGKSKTDQVSRYRIQVSPIRPQGYGPNVLSPGKFPYMQSTEVFEIANDGFKVLTSDGTAGFSYQIGGFVEKYD